MRESMDVDAANGELEVNESISLSPFGDGSIASAILENSPALLSLGKLRKELGYFLLVAGLRSTLYSRPPSGAFRVEDQG